MKRMLIAFAAMVVAVVVAPAPAHASGGARIWFRPGDGRFLGSSIWSFDGTTSTGFRKDVQPSLTEWPVQTQWPFTYRGVTATQVSLTYTVSGGHSTIIGLGYSSATDTMHVNLDGMDQYWYGCRSGKLPAYAAAAC